MSLNKKIQQLKTLLKLKEVDVRTALKSLNTVRMQFDHAKTQLDKMVQYRKDYQLQIESLGESGCSINKMRNRIVFIEKLDQGIMQLNQQLAMIAKQRKQCELTLIEKQKKVKSIEKLIDLKNKNANIALNKLEQKENDEYATKQWYNDDDF